MSDPSRPIRTRRQPPRFRQAEVARVVERSPHLVRVTLTGPQLEGLDPGLPAASVRLLLPDPGAADVVLPRWNGNEFLRDDGSRPLLRTLTPLRVEGAGEHTELDVEVVRHGEAPLSSWVAAAVPGDRVAVSGTGRGYDVDPECRSYLVAGDESALPAISVLLPALPPEATVAVLVEIRDSTARLDLPHHPGATTTWVEGDPAGRIGDALVAAVEAASIPDDTRVWAAGEAAAVQQIRRHLFEQRGLPRSRATIRGYWKHGRGGDDDG